MNTTYDTDPNTATVASAWASSPRGQLDDEVGSGFALEPDAEADDRRPIAKHAIVAAALACGIAGGAALGLTVLELDPTAPTTVVPGVDISPHHPSVVSQLPPEPVVTQRYTPPTRTAAPATAPVNKPSVPDVGTPPAPAPAGDTVVLDIPDFPPLAEDPAPEQPQPDPDPQPPIDDDPVIKIPEPQPDPEPPVFDSDLPLAPKPKPEPKPQFDLTYLAP